MEKIVLKIEKLSHCTSLPEYQTQDSSGMDLCAAIESCITLAPMERRLIPIGIKIEIPKGYEAQIRPRSGLSIKSGITLVNCVGTIDADYRGEICVPLINLSDTLFVINPKDRIAQMVIAPVLQAKLEVSKELCKTERASGGFGSTGV